MLMFLLFRLGVQYHEVTAVGKIGERKGWSTGSGRVGEHLGFHLNVMAISYHSLQASVNQLHSCHHIKVKTFRSEFYCPFVAFSGSFSNSVIVWLSIRLD